MIQDFLKKNAIVIIGFVITLTVTWTQFDSRITALEEKVAKAEARIEVLSSSVNSINVSLGEIKATLEFIKDKLTQ